MLAACSVALVGLPRRRAVHDHALFAMLAVGSEAPRATRGRMCAALVGRVCEGEPPQRGRRKGTWRARARQDASFKVPPRRDHRAEFRPFALDSLPFALTVILALEAAREGRGGRSSTPPSRAAAPEVDDATPEGGGAAGSSPSPPCGALMAGCVAREGGGWRTEHRAGQRRGCGSGTRVRALPRCRAGVPDPADVAGSRRHGAASVMRCEPGLTDRARWLLPLSGFSWAALPPRHA